MIEPRRELARLRARRTGVVEVELTVWPAEPHARQRVDREPQTILACQVFVPARRSVAIHMGKRQLPVIVAQQRLDLRGRSHRFGDVPTRWNPGVNEHTRASAIVMKQRTMAQPVDQCLAIRRGQYVVERVLRYGRANLGG